MENNISGAITKAVLKSCCNWFLYIFIAADAGLSKKIMAKRANQIKLLKMVDAFAWFNDFNDCVQYVEDGIREKYGLSPVQVLSMIYNINAQKISGIGSVPIPTSGVYYDTDQKCYVENGTPLSDAQQTAAANLGTQVGSSKANFWATFKSVVEWVVKIIQQLGLTSKNFNVDSSTVDYSDWEDPSLYKQEAGLGGTIPYIVGGVVLYYLFTKTTGKKTKS